MIETKKHSCFFTVVKSGMQRFILANFMPMPQNIFLTRSVIKKS